MLAITVFTFLTYVPLSSSKLVPVQLARVAAIALIFSALLSFNVYYVDLIGSGLSIFSGLFHVSTLSQAMDIFMFVAGSWLLLPWASYVSGLLSSSISSRPVVNEYSLIILLTLVGSSFLVSSSDLVSLFLAIELQSFAVYVLAAIYRNHQSATAAGLKYFLLGALSSALILLGSALIYGFTGLTNFDSIATLMSSSSDNISVAVTLGLVILSIGLLWKLAAAPLHHWSPDVLNGTPTIVTSWLAIMPKISIIVLLYNLHFLTDSLGTLSGVIEVNIWQELLVLSSLLSLLIGSVLGLAQVHIKRLFAYSSVSHMGGMLLAVAIGGAESTEAFLFYLIQYSFTSINVFFILLAFGYLLHSKTNHKYTDIQYIKDLSGQFWINPMLSISMLVCLFSMSGVPPMVGFFAKYEVLYTAIHNGYVLASLILILTSVVSAFYYLKIVKVLYFEEPVSLEQDQSGEVLSSTHAYIISVLTAGIVLFMLQPTIITNCTQLMAMSIYGY